MVRRMRTWYPKLSIAGSRNGYFTDDEAGAVADEVRASGASLLFLGMTSPKKEKFVATYGERTGAHVLSQIAHTHLQIVVEEAILQPYPRARRERAAHAARRRAEERPHKNPLRIGATLNTVSRTL